ncbi:hypothetical protein V501_04424 [Pseudogymnoascus sp. VKM F-4519 (FW-2642)]|nr:hypothetical protein V501_04424 [Pseudogymnoascus sp. VKM F-4519 (FW-2642)]
MHHPTVFIQLYDDSRQYSKTAKGASSTMRKEALRARTDMGEGNCCSECSRGASKDQKSILKLAPMLSSGECKSIIFGPASPQGLPLQVNRIYGTVRFKATIPIPGSNGDSPQPVTCDIPVNGLFDEQNNPLVQKLFEIVDRHFVPKIVGQTQQDCGLIAYACRGFGLCKLLIMAQYAQFPCSDLQSDFIWIVVQQIDKLLQMSLLKCAKHGQSANLFGSRQLFEHVWCWVGHVWDELSNRWKTACRQQDNFYKGFKTAHEEIAKLVHNFTLYFEMSMWELPAEPSRLGDYNGFHQYEPPTDWAGIQQAISSPREPYGNALITSPDFQKLGHHMASSNIYGTSFNPLWLDGNYQLPFNGAANRYSDSNQGYVYPTTSYHLDEHPSNSENFGAGNNNQGYLYPTTSYHLDQNLSNFENFWAGYDTWPLENQIPFPAKGEEKGTSLTNLIPKESHFSHECTPFFQQPFIQMPPQSEYSSQMLLAGNMKYTFFSGDAHTTPRYARDEGPAFLSTMHQQDWPLYYNTGPTHPHHPSAT